MTSHILGPITSLGKWLRAIAIPKPPEQHPVFWLGYAAGLARSSELLATAVNMRQGGTAGDLALVVFAGINDEFVRRELPIPHRLGGDAVAHGGEGFI